MGTVHLIVDDEHKLYFDMDNFLLPPEARREQSFELFLLKANDGDTETPAVSTRYRISREKAWELYRFIGGVAAWKVRNVADCWDDLDGDKSGYDDVQRDYTRFGSLL